MAIAAGLGLAAAWAVLGRSRHKSQDRLLLRALEASPLPRNKATLTRYIAQTLEGLDRSDVLSLLGPPARTLGNTLVFATAGDATAPLLLVTFDADDEVVAVDCLDPTAT